jgi:hypothetical protein
MKTAEDHGGSTTNLEDVGRGEQTMDCLPSKPRDELLVEPLLNYLRGPAKEHIFIGVRVMFVLPIPYHLQGIGCLVVLNVETSMAITFDCWLIALAGVGKLLIVVLSRAGEFKFVVKLRGRPARAGFASIVWLR